MLLRHSRQWFRTSRQTRYSRRQGTTAGSGSSLPFGMRALPDTHGTATGTRSARGWQWPGFRSKNSNLGRPQNDPNGRPVCASVSGLRTRPLPHPSAWSCKLPHEQTCTKQASEQKRPSDPNPQMTCNSFRNLGFYGAPGEIRTPDLLIRSQSLYPAELRAHTTGFQRNLTQNSRDGRAAQSAPFRPQAPIAGEAATPGTGPRGFPVRYPNPLREPAWRRRRR